MSRPRLNETERKGRKLTVRFRVREMEELAEQADLCGLSVSELIRRRSLHRRIVPATDLKVISELRRLGGLIKLLFRETNGLYGHMTAPLLDELRAAVIRVGRGGKLS